MGITVLLLLVTIPQAEASLIGDTVHIILTDTVNNICDEFVVVGPGLEIPNCAQISIDIDADSIWFESVTNRPNGAAITAATFEFIGLDWIPGPGIITDVTVIAPTTVPINPVQFDDHNILLTNNAFNLDCGGLSSCLYEWHVDITTDHQQQAVGGELIPLNTSALLVAGAQANAAWMIPLMVAVAGFGLVISRKL